MARLWYRRSSVLALSITAFLPLFVTPPAANASRPGAAPPPGLNVARPTVAGYLVAKPGGSESVPCTAKQSAPVRAQPINQGLVICTNAGRPVLLQLSAGTRFFDRNWDGFSIGQMALKDRIRAWGVLTQGGAVLDPTYAVQDVSQPREQVQTVTGTLIAKPIGGAAGSRILCHDQDRTAAAQPLLARGLVICTEEARLILLELSPQTRMIGADGAKVDLDDLIPGDRLTARGRLVEGGAVLSPTNMVRDQELQARLTESQDYIAKHEVNLTLFVLQSAAGSPVKGEVEAQAGEGTRIILCGGRAGTWGNLAQGMTVNVGRSIFNTRTMTYVDTGVVRVVSCR